MVFLSPFSYARRQTSGRVVRRVRPERHNPRSITTLRMVLARHGGGSESTEAAMKFARQYFKQTGHPGKYKFISRYHGYHGGTGAAMAAAARTRW